LERQAGCLPYFWKGRQDAYPTFGKAGRMPTLLLEMSIYILANKGAACNNS